MLRQELHQAWDVSSAVGGSQLVNPQFNLDRVFGVHYKKQARLLPMNWNTHGYQAGENKWDGTDLPAGEARALFEQKAQKHIEPWLSALLQSEHVALLIGSGMTTAVGYAAGAGAAGMATTEFGGEYGEKIAEYATQSAARTGRGTPNIEDQFRSAFALCAGLEIIDKPKADALRTLIDSKLSNFFKSILKTERDILNADAGRFASACRLLVMFLLSFSSRPASRDRLSIFTTNYDRLIEFGCDFAGLRIVDRFVGALTPVFRASKVDVDLHYNPPGIRGEPRFLEGVLRLTKLHGSLDWRFRGKGLLRVGLPFGAAETHSEVPATMYDSVMIYPNPAKDVETLQYPYADLFRDFASTVCRPNSTVFVYGYSFGDDHINRVLEDMLTIPSTHVVIFAYDDATNRIKNFYAKSGRESQVTILLGGYFGNFENLVGRFLPRPNIEVLVARQAAILAARGEAPSPLPATPAA